MGSWAWHTKYWLEVFQILAVALDAYCHNCTLTFNGDLPNECHQGTLCSFKVCFPHTTHAMISLNVTLKSSCIVSDFILFYLLFSRLNTEMKVIYRQNNTETRRENWIPPHKAWHHENFEKETTSSQCRESRSHPEALDGGEGSPGGDMLQAQHLFPPPYNHTQMEQCSPRCLDWSCARF